MKRKPTFLGLRKDVIHGQSVEVAVYGEIDPDPTCDFSALLADICGAGPAKLAEIKARIAHYKEQQLAAEFPEFSTIDSHIPEDDFLDTRAENAALALEIYLDDHAESFLPLDKQLRGL